MILRLFITVIAIELSLQAFKTCYDHEAAQKMKKTLLISKHFNEKQTRKTEQLTEFDWRKRHILSPIKNQHLPVYCGSCWAHAAASTMTDRLYIWRGNQYFDLFYLSVQEIISCCIFLFIQLERELATAEFPHWFLDMRWKMVCLMTLAIPMKL